MLQATWWIKLSIRWQRKERWSSLGVKEKAIIGMTTTLVFTNVIIRIMRKLKKHRNRSPSIMKNKPKEISILFWKLIMTKRNTQSNNSRKCAENWSLKKSWSKMWSLTGKSSTTPSNISIKLGSSITVKLSTMMSSLSDRTLTKYSMEGKLWSLRQPRNK